MTHLWWWTLGNFLVLPVGPWWNQACILWSPLPIFEDISPACCQKYRPSVSWQQLANEICWAIVHLLVRPSFMFQAQKYILVFFLKERKVTIFLLIIIRWIDKMFKHSIPLAYLKSIFELFNISLRSVLTKVAKHKLCEGKQKLVWGGNV